MIAKVRRSGFNLTPLRGAGFTIVELVVVMLLVGLLVVFLRPAVNEIRIKTKIYLCNENLRQMSIALRLYASEHKEKFPGRLKELLEQGYVADEKVFDCPGTSHIGTAEDPDYGYTGGLDLMSSSNLALVQDREHNHNGLGKNVLYVSGDIEWHPGAMAE